MGRETIFRSIADPLSHGQLIDIIVELLDTDCDMSFLAQLDTAELELLAACIRERLGRRA